MNLLENVKTKLTSAGLLTGTWKCYIGFIPDDVDTTIGLQYTGGFPQDTHGAENLLQNFQVSVRGGELDHATVAAKWYSVFSTLQDASDITGVGLIQAMATGPMSFVDDKMRPVMTANFRTVVAAG